LAVDVYVVLKDCREFGLRDQMNRAAVSIPSNIAEGAERDSKKVFMHFLNIAKGSCGEVRSQSYRALDFNYITKVTLDELLERTDKISRKTNTLIQHLKKSTLKGPKYI